MSGVARAAWLLVLAMGFGCSSDDSGSGGSGGSGGGGTGGSGGSGGSSGGGTGGTGGTGGATATTLEEACAALANARCDYISGCAPYTFAINFPDLATCRERLAASCVRDRAAPGSTVTPENVSACAARLAADTCQDSFRAPHPECAMPRGTLADGAACISWEQCAGGYCDKSNATMGCGVCTEIGDVGVACSGQIPCDTGLVCFNGQCATAGYLGDTCSDSAPCAGGMRCLSGSCSEPGLVGESCSQTAWCFFGMGAHCDSTLSECVERVAVPLGQACDPAQGYFCAAPAFCAGATCTADGAGAGETCSDQVRCLAPYSCIGGECVEVTAELCPAS